MIAPRPPLRIVSAERMRALEARAFGELALDPMVLMESAARAVAEWVLAERPRQVCVVAGAGNNGGDGIAAARVLKAAGMRVTLHLVKPESALSPLAARQLAIARAFGVEEAPALERAVLAADWVVDALLGIGARQPLGDYAAAVRCLNESGRPILAVDVPSGVCEAGEGPSVSATATLTFHAAKSAMTQYPARAHVGALHVAEIGIAPEFFTADDGLWLDAAYAKMTLAAHAPQTADVHKGTFGHVAVVGGARGKGGALRLSALAAYMAGSGLVTAVAPDETSLSGLARTPEIMTATPATHAALLAAVGKISAMAIGPGLGQAPREAEWLVSLCGLPQPVVVDADGLNILAARPAWHDLMRHGPRVLTPHPLEFARLFGATTEAVQKDRIASARNAARECGAVVVLKGAGTVVAAPDGRWAVNASGGRELAKGGTGDVLAGVIASLLGQRYEAFEAACLGVYVHGAAGEAAAARASRVSVLASQVAQALPKTLARLLDA